MKKKALVRAVFGSLFRVSKRNRESRRLREKMRVSKEDGRENFGKKPAPLHKS